MSDHTSTTTPLTIKTVFVIGIAQWMYEYDTLADAMAGIHHLAKQVEQEQGKLDYIEVRVEFTTGESERCAYKDEERVIAWLRRFERG